MDATLGIFELGNPFAWWAVSYVDAMIFSALYDYVHFHQSEIEILILKSFYRNAFTSRSFSWLFCLMTKYFLVNIRSFLVNISVFLGAIELSILADYYSREIAAYDIQTARCDLYGQVS